MRDAPSTALGSLFLLLAAAVGLGAGAAFLPWVDCPPNYAVSVIPLGQHDASTLAARLQELLQGKPRPGGIVWREECPVCGGRGRISLFRKWRVGHAQGRSGVSTKVSRTIAWFAPDGFTRRSNSPFTADVA